MRQKWIDGVIMKNEADVSVGARSSTDAHQCIHEQSVGQLEAMMQSNEAICRCISTATLVFTSMIVLCCNLRSSHAIKEHRVAKSRMFQWVKSH